MKSTLDVGYCDELGFTHRVEMSFDVRHGPCFTDEMTIKSDTSTQIRGDPSALLTIVTGLPQALVHSSIFPSFSKLSTWSSICFEGGVRYGTAHDQPDECLVVTGM